MARRETPDPRRARNLDRDERVYERRRRVAARRRAERDRASFDPAPPGDEDWITPDEDTDAVHRVSAPSPLGDALERYVASRGWTERLRAGRVYRHWEELVGPDLAARCEPIRIAGGTLVVRAESQAWATQLRYLTPALLRNAEQVLGAGTVRSIRLVVGPLQGTEETT
jgi:predicted nucleic acid-binding Zn ribbon protein